MTDISKINPNSFTTRPEIEGTFGVVKAKSTSPSPSRSPRVAKGVGAAPEPAK